MKNRREFLKGAATGAVLLGSQSKLGLASVLEQRAGKGKSKVVVARDAAVKAQGSHVDEKQVRALLDRAIAAYTGRRNPVDAWKHILALGGGPDQVIGLKANGLGGRGISTHMALIMAVSERLQQAGVKPGNIVAWDRNARDLRACGLDINTDHSRMRCFGSDMSGFEDQTASWGTARVRFSKILSRECGMVINMPILKDHRMAGVTFAMKNMYGVIERPSDLHANGCNPGVADLYRTSLVQKKVRFIIGDALSSVYDGGPGFRPERLWYPNALIVGEDPVAVDHTAWQMIEHKRAEEGLATLEAVGRAPRYIATAADSAHRLGTNNPKRINLVEI